MTDVLDTPAEVGELPDSPRWPLDVEPWAHQAEAFAFAMERPGTLLAIGLGGGKSAVAIATAEGTQAQRILVLCPKSVVGVWPREFDRHGTRALTVWAGRVHGARGPKKNPTIAERAVALSDAYKASIRLGQPLLAVVNYDACWQSDMRDLLGGLPWDLVILDESHRIKSPSGKASKHAARIAWRTRERGGRVLALTGTPMPHTPLDVWAQARALDGGLAFGLNYHSFCRRYGKGEQIYTAGGVARTIYKGVAAERLATFNGKLADLVYQKPQAELDAELGLPETVDVHRTCELEPKTRKAYAALEADLIAEIGDDVVTAANAMVLTTRLAQMSGGFAKTVDGDLIQVGDEKAKLLADVLEDIEPHEPVVVFARFHADLDAIERVAQASGRRYGELSGRRRDGLSDTATLARGVEILGCQFKSGGVGIDLTAARYAVYYSLCWELADYEQSRKRVHRPGQTRRTTYLHLLAADTIDWSCVGALRNRRDVIAGVMADLREKGPS